jgi:hypothetical protein
MSRRGDSDGEDRFDSIEAMSNGNRRGVKESDRTKPEALGAVVS